MKVLQRYFVKSVLQSVLFVLVAFLALFAFFDLISELSYVGRGSYRLRHAFLVVLINVPDYIYELMPVAVLIGTIYSMALFASNSEFTIMRVSSMSTFMAGATLFKIGVIFWIFTFTVGELLAPVTAKAGAEFKMRLIGKDISGKMRSGLWGKDVLRKNGEHGETTGTRFINASVMRRDGILENIRLYEFDKELRLMKTIAGQKGHYLGNNRWELHKVTEMVFQYPANAKKLEYPKSAPIIHTQDMPSITIFSEITPEIWAVLETDPRRMSAYDLAIYNQHLEGNSQDAGAYQIAFWKKIIYPFSVFVMMAMALPFAYLHFRSGGVSVKIFSGIMIGVAFILINNLFSHVGLLNTWPPFLTAVLPSLIFLGCAIGAILWVDRH